jgi:co-chaperonin GroES (HSP10)
MSKLKAMGTRLYIEKIESAKTTAMGIVLQSAQEVPRARILDVGSQVKEDLKIGDIIVVDWSRVGQMKFENDLHFMVDESTILAVLE